MFEHHIFTNFVYLVVIINPISLVPEFLYITKRETPERRRRTALRAILAAAAILIAFLIVGQILLEALGITLPSFSIAGGLVLLAISMMRILKTAEVTHEEDEAEIAPKDVAIFPLATPYIAGPASILAVVLLTNNDQFGFVEQAETTLVMLSILALTYLALLGADTIQRFLGDTGADVLNRISGLILAALSVETILDGIRASFSLG